MNDKKLLILHVVLGVLGIVIAGIGVGITARGGKGGIYTWVGIGLTFVAASLLVSKGVQKK